MRREFLDGVYYHVTSRTNNRIRVFENNLGRKIMLITLQDAKEKYRFCLANFCIMPTHIHLLIKPAGQCLSEIMRYIKTRSAKWWNRIHGSEDHMWGKRYFARVIRNLDDFNFVMNYIDQNPVTTKLAESPAYWKGSGAFYKERTIPGLVDLNLHDNQPWVALLPQIPFAVSRLLPVAQLEQTIKYYGAYAEDTDRLLEIIPKIPKLDELSGTSNPTAYLHYYTITSDYFIYEYDGDDTMYGKIRSSLYPDETKECTFSLSRLITTPYIKLDFSWKR